MTGATTIPTVISRLLVLAQEDFGAAQLGRGTGAEELDGLFLFADEHGPTSLHADIEWAEIGARSQDEMYTIPCLAFVRSGDTDEASELSLVAQATAILTAFAQRLIADVSLNIPNVRNVHVSNLDMDFLTERGTRVRIVFTVSVTARI